MFDRDEVYKVREERLEKEGRGLALRNIIPYASLRAKFCLKAE